MSRIAQAALSILAAGPVAVADIGRLLARQGVTRARDPGAAVRRALRDDPRVVSLHDGRLARIDQGLRDVVLTTRVTRAARDRGALDVDGDLAPLALLGLASAALPDRIAAGDTVAVRVEDVAPPRLAITALTRGVKARLHDEAELLDAIGARLVRTEAGLAGAAPITRLAPLFLSVVAADPASYRTPGRPLGEALKDAGWELHLGWVGGRGAAWDEVTENEVRALEADVADLLAGEQALQAAEVQHRVVGLVRRHLPHHAPSARRRLARLLSRAGRVDQALEVLTGAFRFRDPEDHYEAALLAVRTGDVVSSRRWVNEGLALVRDGDDEVALCLDDLASDLDAQAAFFAARETLGTAGDAVSDIERCARAITAPRRSYLVEALVEETFAELDFSEAARLIEALSRVGDTGPDACRACAAVLDAPLAALAAERVGDELSVRPWITALAEARPVAAWSTRREDAPDQQQVLVAVAKEEARIAGLVALIDHGEMGGAVKDAFFLPDLAEPRLQREVFGPMADMGVPSEPAGLRGAVEAVTEGLVLTDALGWRMPSESRQPVRARIERWIVRPGVA